MNQTLNGNDVTEITLSSLAIFTSYSIFVQARTVELGEMSNTFDVTTDEDSEAPIQGHENFSVDIA